MKKALLLATVIAFITAACSKRIEDRLVGSWKLRSSYKQKTFDRDHFSTGYEEGVFTQPADFRKPRFHGARAEDNNSDDGEGP